MLPLRRSVRLAEVTSQRASDSEVPGADHEPRAGRGRRLRRRAQEEERGTRRQADRADDQPDVGHRLLRAPAVHLTLLSGRADVVGAGVLEVAVGRLVHEAEDAERHHAGDSDPSGDVRVRSKPGAGGRRRSDRGLVAQLVLPVLLVCNRLRRPRRRRLRVERHRGLLTDGRADGLPGELLSVCPDEDDVDRARGDDHGRHPARRRDGTPADLQRRIRRRVRDRHRHEGEPGLNLRPLGRRRIRRLGVPGLACRELRGALDDQAVLGPRFAQVARVAQRSGEDRAGRWGCRPPRARREAPSWPSPSSWPRALACPWRSARSPASSGRRSHRSERLPRPGRRRE